MHLSLIQKRAAYFVVFLFLVLVAFWLIPRRTISPEARCEENVRTILDAFWKYVEVEQAWPWELEQLTPYLKDRRVLYCPAATNRTQYSYELDMTRAPISFGKPNHHIAIREREPNHAGKRIIGRFDGTVETETPRD